MAAHSNKFIRLRLHFDYPPPAVVDCRMCWLLVDLSASRVVADLESAIREKFEFSRGSVLSLFVDDCYLPHTESIYVVRDNDSVRVKVDRLFNVNEGVSHLDKTRDSCKKRQRQTEEDGPEENGVNLEFKKKKRKKTRAQAEEDGPGENGVNIEFKKKKRKKTRELSVGNVKKPDSSNTGSTQSNEKSTEKNKKKKTKKERHSTITQKHDVSTKKKPRPVDQTVQNKISQIDNVSSSDSSSSEEDDPPKKTAAQKSTPGPSKAPSTSKPAQKKPAPPSSSSSDSSSDENTIVKPAATSKSVAPTTVKPAQKKTVPSSSSSSSSSSDEDRTVQAPQRTKASAYTTPQAARSTDKHTPVSHKQQASSQDQAEASSSEDEIPFIIHKPVQQPGFGVRNQSSWGGRGGRGKSWRSDPGQKRNPEGGGASGGMSGSTEPKRDGALEPSNQTDSLSNTSVLVQNGAENAPKKDYSSMPLLAAPPKVGQTIAFKLLELTENYTPEVSEYKEGKIVSFDTATRQIELELHNTSRAPVEPGKFDLVYQNADGTESVEYAVSRDSRVTERWESLLEPRLIL